jgi:hypothetical protein
MTEAAMTSILNKYIQDFDKDVMEWVHNKQDLAFNQVIKIVTNTNPPPLEVDPRILKFVKHKATDLKT